VAGKEDALLAELIGDGDDVGSEVCEGIRGNAAGLAAFVVAALIGNDDAKTGGGERLDLFVPGVPEFREAMKKDDDGTVAEASGDGMEFDVAVVEGQVLEGGTHGCGV
jgi:hypothetical protein